MKQLTQRKRRHNKVRAKIKGVPNRPRLFIFKSNKHTYAGVVDDTQGKTLIAFSDASKDAKMKEKTKTNKAGKVGEIIGKKAQEKGIKKVVFDRGGYRYHGRVKALAQGARKSGLIF